MHNPINDNIEIHVEKLYFQQIPNWILEADISSHAIRLYLVLQKFGSNKDKTSYWSRKKIAKEIKVSPATMDRAKTELINLGAICQVHRFTEDQEWTSNLYHVHWEQNAKCLYLKKLGIGTAKSDKTHPTGEHTPLITGDELTNNHLELRTNELNTRTYGDEDIRLANLLGELIIENGSKAPKVSKDWYSDIEKLHRLDGRSYEQIESAIRWSQNDPFWRGNILSANKLRKQYDAMRLQAQRDQKKSKVTQALNWMKEIKWDDDTKEINK